MFIGRSYLLPRSALYIGLLDLVIIVIAVIAVIAAALRPFVVWVSALTLQGRQVSARVSAYAEVPVLRLARPVPARR